MKTKKKPPTRKDLFVSWLKKNELTTEQFANSAGVSYNTAVKWRNGCRPHPFARRTLSPKFPNCPLFA